MLKILIEAFKASKGRMPNALEMLQLRFKAAQQAGKGEVVQFPQSAITDWTKPRPTTGKKADVTELDEPLVNELAITETLASPTRIKQEAIQRFKDMNKVVDMQGRTLDPSKTIMGGTQEGAALKSGIMKATGAKPKKVSDSIKKQIEDKYGITLQGDETMGEIEKMIDDLPIKKADGGVAGMLGERQNFAMGRRAFMKLLGGAAAGIGALKTGVSSMFGKKAAPVATEVVKSAGSGTTPPPYFFNLVNKIKTLGDDTLPTKDKVIAKKYKDYVMEEDFSGNIEIIKKSGDDMFPEDVYMSYKVDEVPIKKGKRRSTKVEEYEEYTARPDQDGKMKDVEEGVPDEVIQEGTMFEDNITDFKPNKLKTKKASGGLAHMVGE